MNTDWALAKEPWERLRWARTQRFPTARAAAESLGDMKEATYAAYEREPGSSKHTPLSAQRAIQFGRKFKVSWTWLLTGEGTPFDAAATEAQVRVQQAMAAADEADQERIAAVVEVMLKKAG